MGSRGPAAVRRPTVKMGRKKIIVPGELLDRKGARTVAPPSRTGQPRDPEAAENLWKRDGVPGRPDFRRPRAPLERNRSDRRKVQVWHYNGWMSPPPHRQAKEQGDRGGGRGSLGHAGSSGPAGSRRGGNCFRRLEPGGRRAVVAERPNRLGRAADFQEDGPIHPVCGRGGPCRGLAGAAIWATPLKMGRSRRPRGGEVGT